MRRFLVCLVTLFCIVDLWARAGGGGSYRSSGSSGSSRSSGSSSSRSSSSSSSGSSGSSYRPSTSSSSTRPSSSSGYRSSSGSSYSAPAYTTLSSFKAVKRTYTFQEPGKLTVTESVTVAVSGKGTQEFLFEPSAPMGRWELVSAAADLTKIKNARKGTNGIYFHLATPAPGNVELSFTSVLKYYGTPGSRGALVGLYPRCAGAQVCDLKFEGLTPADSIEPVFTTPGKKTERRAGSANFGMTDLIGIESFTLRLAGENHRAAALHAWKEAELLTHLETRIQIGTDGEANIRESVRYDKAADDMRILYLKGPDERQHYLSGSFEGIYGGHYSQYIDSELSVTAKTPRFGYSLIHTVTTNAKGQQQISLPLPALKPSGATRWDTTPKYLSDRQKIEIEHPGDMELEFLLFECSGVTDNPCRTKRPIGTEVKQEQGKTILIPEEAQVSEMWLLQAGVKKGTFTAPGFLKRVGHSFDQYHKMGKYPRWVFWLYFLVILGGLILAIVIFRILARRKNARLARQKNEQREADTLRDLLKRDPAFNADAFRQRSREIATEIQRAWAAGDMRNCRRFLSQGVYNRFRIQLKIMRELEKRQNAMADFRILDLKIFARQRSGLFDALIVRLEAEARDVMVDVSLSAADAEAAAKKAPLQSFVEFYTFMRRRDATTQSVTALNACNRCGTPFSAEGELTKCKNCGAVMGSGIFDWVLAEITQEVEYGKARGFKLPDKEISPDRIEDRASFVFWRNLMQRVTGKKEYLYRDATAAYISSAPESARFSDIAVGAADLEAYSDKPRLEAKVRIKWSAKGPADKEPRHRQSVLTLVAEDQAARNAGFDEHSCESCGAPLPESDAETCAYCRSPIQRKNKDWLLEEVETTVE